MSIVTQDKLDRVYEAYTSGKLSRRHFIKYLTLAGATIGLMGSPLGNLVSSVRASESIRFDG